MKKWLLTAVAAAGLGMMSSAYAANPFSDVPAGHWAYDSIAKLAAAGVIDGYGDTTFKGDRLMTRYEMAQIVAKAMAKGANVDKLAAEFADELDALGVRVAALEKKADNVKIVGQIRYSYKQNKREAPNKKDVKDSEAALRTRILFTGKVNNNWDYIVRLQNIQLLHGNDGADYVGEDDVKLNRAYLLCRLGGAHVEAGRTNLFLANGKMYDDSLDGVLFSYGDKYKFGGYYGKLTESYINNEASTDSDKGWGANVDATLCRNVNLIGGYDHLSLTDDYPAFGDKVNVGHAGLKLRFGKDVLLTSEWMHTNADDNENGAYASLDLYGASYKKPGSFGFGAVYYDLPAGAAFKPSKTADWKGQGLWKDGFKGYNVSASYTFAKNMMATVSYWDLESRVNSSRKNKTMWSEVQLRF